MTALQTAAAGHKSYICRSNRQTKRLNDDTHRETQVRISMRKAISTVIFGWQRPLILFSNKAYHIVLIHITAETNEINKPIGNGHMTLMVF